MALRSTTTLKRDGAWLIGWVLLFVGGLSLGAAVYLALYPNKQQPSAIPTVVTNAEPKPVAALLLETRRLHAADRQQLKRLLDLLNITISADLPWSLLMQPEQLGDGVLALHGLDNHFWLQLPSPDGHTEWLPSAPNLPLPEFLYALGDKPQLISGHLPKVFWQTLLPELNGDNCLIWSQVQPQLPEQARLAVDSAPLHLQLRWPWPNTISTSHHLPHHQPAEKDALYSAALMADSEHCDESPTLLRLWPNQKNKAQLVLLQGNGGSTTSPLLEFPLTMHAVANIPGAAASSDDGKTWLKTALTTQFDGGELLYHSYVHPARMAQLRQQAADATPAVEVQVWWLNNEIVMDLRWSE